MIYDVRDGRGKEMKTKMGGYETNAEVGLFHEGIRRGRGRHATMDDATLQTIRMAALPVAVDKDASAEDGNAHAHEKEWGRRWQGGGTHMTMKHTTCRSRISSSYCSDSSVFGSDSTARTALYNPDPGCAGFVIMGCISDTARVAPMGNADAGAIVSAT